MRNQYEHGLYSAQDDYTGLSLVSVESQIEGSIRVEEACHIEILKKEARYKWSCCVVASQ